jgi:hypothetical protein
VQGLKTLFFAGILTALYLFSNRINGQSGHNGVEEISSDFRFELQLCDSSESSSCKNFKRLSMSVYLTINDSLIDKLYFCSDQDNLYAENFLQIGDYNFDGHTDFRILTRKSTTLVEKTRGRPEYINDYDFYMFDISNNKFYCHLISSLRQVKIDPFKKNVTGTLYNNLNNSSSSEKQPTSYHYKFNGEGLKYCTISPLSYPEPHQFFGNFAHTYRILEGRDLRSATEEDTLIITPIIKYESGFKFVKIRQMYPRKIDMEKNPNISYRNIYRIYSLTTDQLLSEIIGEYESLFGTHSDSIHTADCNFDGYPDLTIKDEHNKIHTPIYFYNAERQTFYQDYYIKQLENLSIDFNGKTITGKNTTQAFERTKYGQLREPKKKIWREYEFIGPSLKYVKVQTKTFTQKRGRKMKTNYYIYDRNSLKPIRKKEFLSYARACEN